MNFALLAIAFAVGLIALVEMLAKEAAGRRVKHRTELLADIRVGRVPPAQAYELGRAVGIDPWEVAQALVVWYSRPEPDDF